MTGRSKKKTRVQNRHLVNKKVTPIGKKITPTLYLYSLGDAYMYLLKKYLLGFRIVAITPTDDATVVTVSKVDDNCGISVVAKFYDGVQAITREGNMIEFKTLIGLKIPKPGVYKFAINHGDTHMVLGVKIIPSNEIGQSKDLLI